MTGSEPAADADLADTDQQAALRGLLERDAIRAVVLSYASSIDTKDWARLAQVFTQEATATLASGEVLRGRDVIIDYIRNATTPYAFQHHLLSVYQVDVDGDEARALTYHHSYQVVADDPSHSRILVGRYHDRLVRDADDGRWRVAEKVLEIGWREERQLPESR